MNEYSVKDYQTFSNMAGRTSDYVNLLINNMNNIKAEANKLSNPELFFGPICDSVIEEWDKINSKSDELINGFKKILAYLNETSSSYAEVDAKTSKEIGGDVNG